MQAEAQPLAIDARGVELAFGERVGVLACGANVDLAALALLM